VQGGATGCRLSQVIEGPIHFYSICEHHSLPFFGVAHVGYVPNVAYKDIPTS
jgi:GTP cyclohydrolase I